MWKAKTPKEVKAIIEEQRSEITSEPTNLEEQAISLVGRDIFEKLMKVEGSEKHIMTHEWFTAHPGARELWRQGRGDYTPNHFRECGKL